MSIKELNKFEEAKHEAYRRGFRMGLIVMGLIVISIEIIHLLTNLIINL